MELSMHVGIEFFLRDHQMQCPFPPSSMSKFTCNKELVIYVRDYLFESTKIEPFQYVSCVTLSLVFSVPNRQLSKNFLLLCFALP